MSESKDLRHVPRAIPAPSGGEERPALDVRIPEVPPDPGLRGLLRRWQPPDVPESTDVSILGRYRLFSARVPWWRRLLRLLAPLSKEPRAHLASGASAAFAALAALVVIVVLYHGGLEQVSAAEVLRDARRAEIS